MLLALRVAKTKNRTQNLKYCSLTIIFKSSVLMQYVLMQDEVKGLLLANHFNNLFSSKMGKVTTVKI